MSRDKSVGDVANPPMDEMLRQVITLFAEELREHSLVIAQSLIQARRSSSVEERRALVAEVLRRAHGIKGHSGTLGIFDVEDLMHSMEIALRGFRSGDQRMGPRLARQILFGLHQAQRLLEKVATGADVSDPALRATAAELLRSAG